MIATTCFPLSLDKENTMFTPGVEISIQRTVLQPQVILYAGFSNRNIFDALYSPWVEHSYESIPQPSSPVPAEAQRNGISTKNIASHINLAEKLATHIICKSQKSVTTKKPAGEQFRKEIYFPAPSIENRKLECFVRWEIDIHQINWHLPTHPCIRKFKNTLQRVSVRHGHQEYETSSLPNSHLTSSSKQ